jgi:hypothetical protein
MRYAPYRTPDAVPYRRFDEVRFTVFFGELRRGEARQGEAGQSELKDLMVS